MSNKTTHYQLILDRSGSMNDCIAPTISGFNEQMDLIRSLNARYPDQEITVSLTIFNQVIEPRHSFADPDLIPILNERTYIPAGMTALLDAIGVSVSNLHQRIKNQVQKNEASAVVVIITDGYENSSKEYSRDQVAKMISELEATDKWTFSYIGATLDAVDVAASMNIRRRNSMHYDKENSGRMYNRVQYSMSDYMEKKARGITKKNFLEDDEATNS